MATDITPGEADELHVFLAPPFMMAITTTEITLFDGGDAGRVLWRKPAPPKT